MTNVSFAVRHFLNGNLSMFKAVYDSLSDREKQSVLSMLSMAT